MSTDRRTDKPVALEATAHETDHEWRERMAREGKAIYLPGLTSEEAKAKHEAEKRRLREPFTASITLETETVEQAEFLLLDTSTILSDASQTAALVAEALGHNLDVTRETAGRVEAALRILSQALEGFLERNDEHLSRISGAFRPFNPKWSEE